MRRSSASYRAHHHPSSGSENVLRGTL
jgi:hypothetical protein